MKKDTTKKVFKKWKIRYGVFDDILIKEIEGYTLTHALAMHWNEQWPSFKASGLSFSICFYHIDKSKKKEIWCKILDKTGTVSERYELRHRIIGVLKGDIPKDTLFIEDLTPELQTEKILNPF